MPESASSNQQPNKAPRSSAPKRPLVEGIDYYLENGLFVLTAHFLKERGYCCGSGCRHCPYGNAPKIGEASKS